MSLKVCEEVEFFAHWLAGIMIIIGASSQEIFIQKSQESRNNRVEHDD